MKRTFSLALIFALGMAAGVANAGFVLGTPTWSFYGGSASLSTDGLTMFDGYDDVSRPVGYGKDDLWVRTRPMRHYAWSTPINLGANVNSAYADWGPEITADGLALYFSSDRPGGEGGRDLWVTTRPTTESPWTQAANLGSTVNSSLVDDFPSISADQLTLYFGSTRPGGHGGDDLWVTTRPTTNDPWGEPVNLGSTVNSSTADYAPCISRNGRTLFFASTRWGGHGGGYGDIWITRRVTIDDEWSKPVNLGPTVNSRYGELIPEISADGSTLYFASNDRPCPGGTTWAIWEVPITLVVDCNGDGKVTLADFCKLAECWCGEDSSVDIAPPPLGDGRVDIQDMAVFAENWLKDVRMVAHWKLDEAEGAIAHDSAGAYDGTLNGDPVWQPDGGKIGGTLELDGIDDYVSPGPILNAADGPFSAFAWIKGGQAGQVIISQTDGTTFGATWLGANPSNGKLFTKLMDPQPAVVSESVITDGEWHHVGLVWDGSCRHLYADGAEVAKDAAALSYTLSCDGGLNLGAGKALDAGTFFSGLIDDVRVYNQALSPAEIEALAQ